MSRLRIRRPIGWLAFLASLSLLTLYILNLPLYAGASLNRNTHWRMEHGRLTWTHGVTRMPEQFWVAHNTEGLSFAPRFRPIGPGAWEITIPLWLPLFATAAAATICFWPRRRPNADACPKCGYDVRGISTVICPECGEQIRGKRTLGHAGAPSAAN